MKKLYHLIISLSLTILLTWPTLAQEKNITYTVQVGDTLSQIALKYNLNVYDLAAFNSIANPNLIIAGQQMIIPNADTVEDMSELEQTYTIQAGDTLFEVANRFGIALSDLVEANEISNADLISVGDTLVIPPIADLTDSPLPPLFKSIELSEKRIAQGRTLFVSVTLATTATLEANFEDRPIFLTGGGQQYQGLVGIHALSDVGVYSVAFQATTPTGEQTSVAQNVVVIAGPYSTETIQVVSGREDLLDPTTLEEERVKLLNIWNRVSPTQWWDGPFQYPTESVRITSAFGTRRSYGGGPVNGFHGGTDFGGGIGTPIYAPAPGIVVLAETLTVRGNAVIIDHGLSLYSGYWHQNQIIAQVGDHINTGDLIGYLGDTGLVTGPHLHWEMRLGGIAVEPLQWIDYNGF